MSNEIRRSKDGFEIETCSRCGGGGQYSYCQRFGSKCFECGGSGVAYTKRGAIARAFYMQSLCVPAHTLKVGDLMHSEMMSMDGSMRKGYFAPVIEIKESTIRVTTNGVEYPPGIEIVTEHPRYGQLGLHTSRDAMVRKGWTGEEKAEKLAAAHAYEATLTKAGTVRKQAA